MLASGWIKGWKSAHEKGLVGLLTRAAKHGDSLDQVLDIGVQSLLEAAGADRAGLWLSSGRGRGAGQGRVVEAGSEPVPEQWKHLDISMPLLRTALESCDPLRLQSGTEELMFRLGPLVGMRSAVWIPLRARGCAFGLALVAHVRAGVRPDLGRLRACADEIARAIRQQREARRSQMALEEIRGLSGLARAILCGVSVDSILPQIARAARHHLEAEFVALGEGNALSAAAEIWDGPDELRTYVRQESLLQLWRRASEDGREVEITGDAVPARIDFPSEISRPTLERILAVPIEGANRNYGVLMAGLSAAQDPGEDFDRMQCYALLAALSADRERTRGERVAGRKSMRQMIEDSRECLVAVDDQGIVREASQPAVILLKPPWARLRETCFEDFFSSGTRESVLQWLQKIKSPQSNLAPDPENFPDVLEASLRDGANVRLHSRMAVSGLSAGLGTGMGDGSGCGRSMWLLSLENHDEQRSVREAEQRALAEMSGLLQSIESGVLLLDTEGKIRTVSDRLGAILGIDARSLLAWGTIEALMDSLAGQFSRPAETVARWRERVLRGDEAGWDEFELIRPSRKIVERFARPLFQPDGTRLGWLEVYRDITGQRLIQSKLLQTEKMAALGQLVSGIAHELNNPLTSIQGYAQLLLTRRSAPDRANDARRISREAERAARIVKNLLLFARETKPERRAVNLNEVIERTLALRSYELKLENIAVDVLFDPNLPATLADAAQLQQVVLNLILNAEQAILQGRGEEDWPGRIRLRTRRLAGDRIDMAVTDNGPGIPREIVSRIFDPFFTTKPAGLGTGLGLSIVYGIVQEHGGEVNIESQSGSGATLTVELPALSTTGFDFMANDAEIEPHADLISLPPPAQTAIAAERILVVEDEPTVAELIADVMAEEGHCVETLLDSREALGRMEKKHFGLVICDLKMPHLDGPGLYRALVLRGSPLQHKLLFVTGDTMSPRTLEFLKSSGLPYLAKPFLVEELKEAVRLAVAAASNGEPIAARPQRSSAAAREK